MASAGLAEGGHPKECILKVKVNLSAVASAGLAEGSHPVVLGVQALALEVTAVYLGEGEGRSRTGLSAGRRARGLEMDDDAPRCVRGLAMHAAHEALRRALRRARSRRAALRPPA